MVWFHKFTSVLGQMGINSPDRIWNVHLFFNSPISNISLWLRLVSHDETSRSIAVEVEDFDLAVKQ